MTGGEGVRVGEYKAKKGLIRVKLMLSKDRIGFIEITGDFIIHPEEALWKIQEMVKGRSIKKEDIRESILKAVKDTGAVLVGFEVDDIVQAIMEALKDG